MKFVIVTSYLASKGGVARYVWELAEFLVRKGDEVIIWIITILMISNLSRRFSKEFSKAFYDIF